MNLARDIIVYSFVGAALVLIVKNYKGFVADTQAVGGVLTNQTKVLSGG